MIPGVLGAVVERLAADELQALGGAGNAERENVAFRSLTDAGLRIDQELVGGRTVGGEHLGAAHDQAVFGFLDHAEMRELIGLLMRSLGSIGLRIDDGVGGEQVALAAVLVVVANVVGELRAALAEEVGVLGPGHQPGVEEIRRAAEQAEARIGPDLHRQPALDEVGLAARDQERSAIGPAAAVVAMTHGVAMLGRHLKIVQRGDRLHRPGKHRIGGDVINPAAGDPDLARRAAQAFDEFASTPHRHFPAPQGTTFAYNLASARASNGPRREGGSSMAKITRTNPKTISKPFSNYAHVVTVEGAKKLVFCAGQVAADVDGTVLPPDDFYAQAKLVMKNLKNALAAGGAKLSDVTKVTIYICNPHDVSKARGILFDYFGEAPPASTLCILRGLANPNFLLEIEAIAAV